MPTKPLDRLMFVQGNRCFFCNLPLPKEHASVEHLLASSNGGANSDDNRVACCKGVNALFGSMSLKEKFQVVLNQQGQFRCPNDQPPETQSTPPAADHYAKVIKNLKTRGTSKPRLLKTLTSTIASLLKGQPESEVISVIDRMRAEGIVEVSGTKVAYKL